MVRATRDWLRHVLRVSPECGLADNARRWFVQRVLRVNGHVPWPVHFTSRVVHPERVRLGPGSTPGDMPGCYIQAINGIEIGAGCQFGPGVGLISANHDPDDLSRHLPAPPIRLGDDCWIGMNAVILPGIVLGPRTVVGAGAVVTRSHEDGHATLAGNPARPVRGGAGDTVA